MSLGLPTSSNQPSGAGNLASLFSTLNRGQDAGRTGALGAVRTRIDQTYRQLDNGQDWASTLRDTQTQLRDAAKPKAAAAEPAASRAKDHSSSAAADRQADRPTDRNNDRVSDRSTESQAADVRDARHNDARQDTRPTDARQPSDSAAVRLADDRSNESVNTADAATDTDTLDDRASADNASADEAADSAAGAQGDAAAVNEDADDAGESDKKALQAAYAQSLFAPLTGNQPAATPAAQEAQAVAAQTTNAQSQAQADAQTQTQQSQTGQLLAQQQQAGEAAAIGKASAEAGQAIQGKTDGQGKGALPAQANHAANAQSQNNTNALASADAAASQNQQQNHAGQQGNGGTAGQPPQAAATIASTQQAPVLEIQTFPGSQTSSSSAANQAAGNVTAAPTGTVAAQAAITLPPGADALLNAQGQDDADPNVVRIAKGLRSVVNLKGGAVTIRLNPHELGSVRIEMEIKNGNITAQLQTEHASVRDLLNHQLGKLRESLQGRGLHVERLEVNSPAPADDSSAGRHAQESPDQGRSRGQFFQQRGGSNGSDGSDGQQRGESLAERKNFGDMLVDMVG